MNSIDIRTVSLTTPGGFEEQTDYRGDEVPHGILIALADGRVITIGPIDGYDDRIVVHGPDAETLLNVRLPRPAGAWAAAPDPDRYTTCSEPGHVPGCAGRAGGEHELVESETEARAAYGDK